jgi:sortase A
MRALFFSVCIWLLVASGAFLATMGGLDWWESRSAQQEIAQEWDNQQQPSTEPVIEPAPAGSPKASPTSHPAPKPRVERVFRSGAAVAKLTIPRLDTSLYVVEGTDDRDLKRGPGHLTGSVLPGEDGNCVIAGHRDTHFRVLRDIRKGDDIILERDGRQYHYRVDGMSVVSPDNTASLQPTSGPVLNLITCFPFQYIGSAPKRFIVHADLDTSRLSASR